VAVGLAVWGCESLSVLALDPGSVTTNLLTNTGAETSDLSGWTQGGNSSPFVDNGSFNPGISPRSANYDFVGGRGDYGNLSQTNSLMGIDGITTEDIDSGVLFANISFWAQGLNQGTPSDSPRITLTFLDVSSVTISSNSTPEVDSHDGVWSNYSQSVLIPSGSRAIVYTMEFIRHVGSDNDAYIDDNSLTISSILPTPPNDLAISLVGTNVYVIFSTISNDYYDVQSTTDLVSGAWSTIASNFLGTGSTVTNIDVGAATLPKSFYRVGVHF
jgi:hypothetical protein